MGGQDGTGAGMFASTGRTLFGVLQSTAYTHISTYTSITTRYIVLHVHDENKVYPTDSE